MAPDFFASQESLLCREDECMRRKVRSILAVLLAIDLCAIGCMLYLGPRTDGTDKEVSVDTSVLQQIEIAPSGEPIGIYVETSGLLVLDTQKVQGVDGKMHRPSSSVLETGDYILKWQDVETATIRSLNSAIQSTKGKKITMHIRRGEEEMDVDIKPVKATDGTYKIGAWVREDTQGIGTLTYVTKDGEYGTLGHGITDVDTGTLLSLQGGQLYQTKILDVIPGTSGEPGELQGYINMIAKDEIGTIEENTNIGVYGRMSEEQIEKYATTYMPIALKEEIKTGTAYIYINLEGTAKKYEIQIERINKKRTDNKSMQIHVTDKKLLELAGGIVQGMSGSPIIQDGKIIGALTHVLVDDPTRGYAIFIETMLTR